MHPITKRLFTFATVAAALVLAVSHASAQRATFTLPFQVHIGNATLQPGEYRMNAPSATSPVQVLYLYSEGKVQAALPATIAANADSSQSYLELVNVGGTYFVKKFVSGATATTYTFGLPKIPRREILANTRVTSIPVTGGAAN